MKKLLIVSGFALALAAPGMASAAGGKAIPPSVGHAANNQTAAACSICFTCGGDWQVFNGSIRSVGDTPTERGAGCGNPLTSRGDSSPFLCCR